MDGAFATLGHFDGFANGVACPPACLPACLQNGNEEGQSEAHGYRVVGDAWQLTAWPPDQYEPTMSRCHDFSSIPPQPAGWLRYITEEVTKCPSLRKRSPLGYFHLRPVVSNLTKGAILIRRVRGHEVSSIEDMWAVVPCLGVIAWLDRRDVTKCTGVRMEVAGAS